MSPKLVGFLDELKALFKKYNATLESYADYDGEENHCGDHWYVQGEEVNIDMDDIKKYLE